MDEHLEAGQATTVNATRISVDLLLSNLPGAVYRCLNDRRWSMQFVSQGIEDLTGYPPEFFTASETCSFSNIIFPLDRDDVAAQVERALRAHQPFQLTYRIVTASGAVKWVWEQGAAVRGETDEVIALEGFIADYTRVKTADALVVEQASFLDQARDAIFVIDMQRRVTYWNGGAERLFGWNGSEAIGSAVVDLIGLDAHALGAACESALVEGEWCGELLHRHKNGSEVATEGRWSLIPPNAATGSSQKILAISTDIRERKKQEVRMFRMAFFDALTALPNRTSLLDALHKALLASVRSHGVGAVMFCDLDNFKNLNDSKGHATGDAMLQAVARRLEHSVRETDLVARLGGDEFVVLLDASSSSYEQAAQRAESVGENILHNLAPPVLLAGEAHPVSTSIGITLFSGAVDTVESVLMKADAAMYQAKSAGRNTLRFFDPVMQASIDAQQQLERDLTQAFVHGDFVLHYQPQVDSAGRTVGAEALIRWIREDGQLVLPATFIQACESSGQIQEIGTWVLFAACSELARWRSAAETRDLSLSINISAHQFIEPGFLSTVDGILAATGADPRMLRFELTESLLFRGASDAVVTMAALKERGITLTLDDFGTGYSSLAYLRQLPLDQLKIDYSFMRDVLSDSNDAAIVRSIIDLGSNLGLRVIAEGVETVAQRVFLEDAGCWLYQGFLYQKALPAHQFVDYVRSSNAGLAPRRSSS